MRHVTFRLRMKALPLARTSVTRIEGVERMTRPYRFDIDVACPDPDLDLDALIAEPAMLALHQGGRERKLHGVILECTEAGRAAGDRYAYRLSLVPRLALLSLSRRSRTFGTTRKMSVIDVITAVLTASDGLGFAKSDFTFRLLHAERYAERDFWAQYEETDFDFLHRLLEHWGLFYSFEQEDGFERVVFTDSSVLASHAEAERIVAFDDHAWSKPPAQPVVRRLERRLRAVPARVELRDYNPQTPKAPPSGASAVERGTRGVCQEYAAHITSDAEGALFAEARAEEIAATRDIFDMTSTSPFLTTGNTFRLTQHFRRPLNQSYFVTEVRHRGEQRLSGGYGLEAEADHAGYQAHIVAIPAASPYRSPREIRRPVMPGLMPAMVEAPEKERARAALDEQGRYRVKIDFDTADAPVFQRSTPLRMAQPYAGPNRGMHFPLLAGTEVALGWVGGDPDRPLILGAVPNAQTMSPTVKANRTENRIETPSGMLFVMDDGPVPIEKEGAEEKGAAVARPAFAGVAAAVAAGDPPSGIPLNQGDGTILNTRAAYSALVVPAAGETALPHYGRSGDIAAEEPYEKKIIADPTFMAGQVEFRPAELTSSAYAGQFSYTPYHMTTTIGQNETHVVGGSQRVQVCGDATLNVSGGSYIVTYQDSASFLDNVVSARPWRSISADSQFYSATMYFAPRVVYTDLMNVSVYSGLSLGYACGIELRVDSNVGGIFRHRVGPNVSVSGSPHVFQGDKTKKFGSSYSLSCSGYAYKDISTLDKKHSIFAYEKEGIVLGYRGAKLTGKWTGEVFQKKASLSAVWTGAANAITQLAQGLVVAETPLGLLGTKPKIAGQIGFAALELGAILPMGYSYLNALWTVSDYFNGAVGKTVLRNQNDLRANLLNEATVTIDSSGITLLNGTSSIVLKPDGIEISAEKLSIGIKNKGSGTSAGAMSFDSSGMATQAKQVTVRSEGGMNLEAGEKFGVLASGMNISAPTKIASTLTASGVVKSGVRVEAPRGKFG